MTTTRPSVRPVIPRFLSFEQERTGRRRVLAVRALESVVEQTKSPELAFALRDWLRLLGESPNVEERAAVPLRWKER